MLIRAIESVILTSVLIIAFNRLEARLHDVPAESMVAPAENQSATLLIVDDDAAARERLRDIFETAQYRVVTATEAASALRVLKGVRCDLVALDLEMPGVDGLALCKLLRAQPLTSKLPIIALSESDDEDAQGPGIHSRRRRLHHQTFNARRTAVARQSSRSHLATRVGTDRQSIANSDSFLTSVADSCAPWNRSSWSGALPAPLTKRSTLRFALRT